MNTVDPNDPRTYPDSVVPSPSSLLPTAARSLPDCGVLDRLTPLFRPLKVQEDTLQMFNSPIFWSPTWIPLGFPFQARVLVAVQEIRAYRPVGALDGL